MKALLELPVPVAFLIVIVVSVALAIAGLKLVRRKFTAEMLKENHEVAGFIFNAFGLIYAVLVAFVVFATWTDYDDAREKVELEANKLGDLFLDAESFRDDRKTMIRNEVTNYTQIVYNEEWENMSNGEGNPAARKSLENLWRIYADVEYSTLKNPAAYAESLKRLNDLGDYRRLRILAAMNAIPAVIWFVLIIGGIISVCYTYFFGSKNLTAQYIMTAALTITNALILFLIYILDHPFVGRSALTKEPFQMMMEMFKEMMK